MEIGNSFSQVNLFLKFTANGILKLDKLILKFTQKNKFSKVPEKIWIRRTKTKVLTYQKLKYHKTTILKAMYP